MSEILTYQKILSDIKSFKQSGTYDGDEFNVLDTPAQKYFKILFYFGSTSEDGWDHGNGLLAPTWEYVLSKDDHTEYYNHYSAWSYLKLNDENERAEKLEQFVTLLSDINTKSPWYFSKLGGLQEALERKVAEDGKMELSDKKLTITCLPDAFDNRISTLLELYRDITWSWVHKKEIIPANLRKFDMAVYIFEAPEYYWHDKNSIINPFASENDVNAVSYKMIEFHDCEFNYNSIKSGWNEIDNATGAQPTYTIDITYSDCYEISYNDIMMRTIGDVILTDLLNGSVDSKSYESHEQTDNNTKLANIRQKMYIPPKEPKKENKLLKNKKGWLETAVSQVAGHLVSDVTDWVKQKIMGNIFGFSLTSLAMGAKDLLQGNVIKTGKSIAQYAREKENNKTRTPGKTTGNIFSASTIANNL